MIQDKVTDWTFRIIGDGAFLKNEKKHAKELDLKTVHDQIQDGKNGILVENNNIKKFAQALYHLICDEERRKRLAVTAMADSQKCSVVSICDQWESLFRTVKKCRKYRLQI